MHHYPHNSVDFYPSVYTSVYLSACTAILSPAYMYLYLYCSCSRRGHTQSSRVEQSRALYLHTLMTRIVLINTLDASKYSSFCYFLILSLPYPTLLFFYHFHFNAGLAEILKGEDDESVNYFTGEMFFPS